MECLQRFSIGIAFYGLADVDKGGNVRTIRRPGARDDGADMRHSYALWWLITGVPVELMTAMEKTAQIRRHHAANHHTAIHNTGNIL